MPSPAPPAADCSVVVELPAETDPLDVFGRLRVLRGCVFFDSALRHEQLGRYSYVAADPFAWVTADAGEDAFEKIAAQLDRRQLPTIPGLPPFQGGAAGVFGYDLCHSLERLPKPRFGEFSLPAMAVGLYDVVFAFDHAAGRSWLVSTGHQAPGHPGGEECSHDRAKARAHEFESLLASRQPLHLRRNTNKQIDPRAAQHPLPLAPGVTSDFSRDGYMQAVAKAVESILAGDVFQVNLSQRLLAPLEEPAYDYYLRLRQQSPAPFGGYFDATSFQLCSASPERFLRCVDGNIETRPIKGTRPRSSNPAEDVRLRTELLASEKDHAENTMIVDLLRNDLSRVSTDDSVDVPTLCGLESYEQVHHLVSVVRGRLREGATPLDLLRAAFPGGSITGAPKVRAMEIIARLEPTARGPYCGSLGYIGFNGAMDSSILIRTAIAAGRWLQMPVGGGVVADSDPAAEYEETLHKAAGMLAALKTNQ